MEEELDKMLFALELFGALRTGPVFTLQNKQMMSFYWLRKKQYCRAWLTG